MIKSAPRFKRASMIDCYRMAISHVSGSLQIGPVFHEVITFTTCADVVTRRARWHESVWCASRTMCCASRIL